MACEARCACGRWTDANARNSGFQESMAGLPSLDTTLCLTRLRSVSSLDHFVTRPANLFGSRLGERASVTELTD